MKYIKNINRSIFKRVRHRILNDEFQKPFTVKDPYHRAVSRQEFKNNLIKASNNAKINRTFSGK